MLWRWILISIKTVETNSFFFKFKPETLHNKYVHKWICFDFIFSQFLKNWYLACVTVVSRRKLQIWNRACMFIEGRTSRRYFFLQFILLKKIIMEIYVSKFHSKTKMSFSCALVTVIYDFKSGELFKGDNSEELLFVPRSCYALESSS